MIGVITALTMAVTFLPDSVSTEMTFPAAVMMFPHTAVLCLPTGDVSEPGTDPQREHSYTHSHCSVPVFGQWQPLVSVHLM